MATRTSAKQPRRPPAPRPPADPAAEMIRAAGLGEPARIALVQALAHQLAEDHFAKLDQAGHTEDEGIPLRRVFIDLYTANSARTKPSSKRGVVAELLAMEPAVMGRELLHEEPLFQRGVQRSRRTPCAGLVLIGGPGQGKSTLGQLACQAHRAALLAAHETLLTDRERRALADFTDPEALKELGAPAYPSLPVRIVLPDAAAWIVKEQQKDPKAAEDPQRLPWLLRFWRTCLPPAAQAALHPADLLALLRSWPFLLVLDGLDEVPAAAARQRVLSAVRDLGAALSGARGLVLATTRPQGYAGELDGLGIALETRHLAPLTQERALKYAERLVKARIADGSDGAKVLERMREASREASTQRLMTTPLQVTILAALLRKGGRPPRERWNLFDRYYDVMYQRELAKPTDTAELLHTYKEHIHKIHARAGLLLQVEAENAERTDALLARDRLESIVDAVLDEEGFPSGQRPVLIDQIVAAAAHRLVFLVQPQEDKFGFEIRSLQEFMAAAALAQKSDAATRARLLHVARAGSFRNVTLFLTGKLLAEGGDLRDTIARDVCPALEQDPRDTLAKACKAGSVLALEILEDGAALSQPRRAEDLMRLALGVLDLAPNELQVRLAELLLGDDTPARSILETLLRDALQSRLMQGSARSRLGAWMALLPLVESGERGPAWAPALAERAWPEDGEGQRTIVDAALGSHSERILRHAVGPWLVERIGASPACVSWSRINRLISSYVELRRAVEGDSPIWWLLDYLRYGPYLRVSFLRAGETIERVLHVRSAQPIEIVPKGVLEHLPREGGWAALAELIAFAERPGKTTLASALRAIAEHAPNDFSSFQHRLPWPLVAVMEQASSADDLHALGERAAAGHFGDTTLWREAEEQWRKVIDPSDVLTVYGAGGSPWDPETLLRVPTFLPAYWNLFSILTGENQQRLGRLLMDRVTSAPQDNKHAAKLLAVIFDEGTLKAVFSGASPDERRTLLLAMDRCNAGALTALIDSGVTPATLDEWGRLRPMIFSFGAALANILALMLADNPMLHGIAYLLAQTMEQVAENAIFAPEWIPQSWLERRRFEDPLVRADIWLLRLRGGAVRLDEISTLLQDVQLVAERETGWLSHVVWAATAGALDVQVRDALLAEIYNDISDTSAASLALQQMLQLLQSRTSGLEDPEAWNALELPLPLPRPAAPSTPPPAQLDLASPPFHLHKLTLQNIRSIEHLALDLAVPPPDQGQWVVLLGENGTGKSTILRSIVLALRNLSDPKIWPKGTFASAWRRLGSNPETSLCRITVRPAGGVDHETTIHRNGKEVFSQSPPRNASVPAPCLLWAYGCRRGSALGGSQEKVDVSDDDGPDIATLFHEGASLIHAQTWLTKLSREASSDKTGHKQQIYDAVIGALKKILDVKEIELDDDSNVLVTGEGVGNRVPLATLSDGYLTTAGWLLDLLARWIARATEAEIPIGPDFPEKMTGLVLLDEIDLHLHPTWQLEVIPRVRSIFKRLSFVVTTHNPMTIVGARPEEIWILQRTPDGTRAVRRTDIPATLTAAQIYARFFGVEDFFPNPLGQKLQRYGFLCGNPYRSDDEQKEMEALRAELEKAGAAPGWQELPRALVPTPPKPRQRARRGKPS